MDNAKANALFKLAEALDNSAREVAFRAGRIAAGIPVDRMELAGYIKELNENTIKIADALGYRGRSIGKVGE